MPKDGGIGFRRARTHIPLASQSLREMCVRNTSPNNKPRYLAHANHVPVQLVAYRHAELDNTLLSHPRLALSRSQSIPSRLTPTASLLRSFEGRASGSERSRAEQYFMSAARQNIEIPSRENFVELRSLYPHRRRDAPMQPTPWIHPVPGDPSRPAKTNLKDPVPSPMDMRDCRAMCPLKQPSPRIPDCAVSTNSKFVYDYSHGATRDGGDNNVLGHVSVDYFKQRIKRDEEKAQAASMREADDAEYQRKCDDWESANSQGMSNIFSKWIERVPLANF